MKDEDRKAAEMLASEHDDCLEAVRFLRAELGYGLREAAYVVDRLTLEYPESALAATMRHRGRPLVA